jgi:heptosyltransferase-2
VSAFPFRNVLVLQTWGIGDMIMTTPMLAALRRRCPDARITLLAYDSVAAQAIEGLVDDIRVIAPINTSGSDLVRALRFFSSLRAERFDAAIIATTLAPRFALLLRFVSGIPVVAGDSDPPKRPGYTHWRARSGRHRAIANVDVLVTLFPDVEPGALYFYIDGDARRAGKRLWTALGFDDRAVLGIHPGSNPRLGTDKRPPQEMLRRLIPSFLDEFPESRVALLCGPRETDLAADLGRSDPRVAVIRDHPLRVVAALVSRMRAVLAGDSGLGHVAAALGVPTVTLAGPTAVSTTHPWRDDNTIVRTRETLACMPCYGTPLYGRCPFDVRCMRGIDDDEVMDALAPMFAGVEAVAASRG